MPRPVFSVLRRAREAVDRYGMLRGGEKVLVCVSGGPDSMVLLDVMHRLSGELDLALEVFHVDHALRPASHEDAEYVRRAAGHYGLPFRSQRVAVRREAVGGRTLSPEEAAREARYLSITGYLEESRADKAALGHQADDRVETLLMRLLTGAGPRALASIPPVRGPFIRPLIRVWRKEIGEYLPHLPLTPLEDPTNLDLGVPRNRVRHLLLPLLEKDFNPRVRQSLERVMDLLGEELGGEESPNPPRASGDVGGLCISLRDYSGLSLTERRRMLHRTLLELGVRPGYRLVEDLRRGVFEGRPGNRMCLPGGVLAVNEYGRVVFMEGGRWEEAWGSGGDEVLLEGEGEFSFPGLGVDLTLSFGREGEGMDGFPESAWEAVLDLDRLEFPLRLRGIRPGDRFHPLGAPGGRKVQDFLTDAKVPRQRRGRVLALLSGDSIACLLGLRISDDFKVTASTERVAILRARMEDGS